MESAGRPDGPGLQSPSGSLSAPALGHTVLVLLKRGLCPVRALARSRWWWWWWRQANFTTIATACYCRPCRPITAPCCVPSPGLMRAHGSLPSRPRRPPRCRQQLCRGRSAADCICPSQSLLGVVAIHQAADSRLTCWGTTRWPAHARRSVLRARPWGPGARSSVTLVSPPTRFFQPQPGSVESDGAVLRVAERRKRETERERRPRVQ